jgi:hypothetical protein
MISSATRKKDFSASSACKEVGYEIVYSHAYKPVTRNRRGSTSNAKMVKDHQIYDDKTVSTAFSSRSGQDTSRSTFSNSEAYALGSSRSSKSGFETTPGASVRDSFSHSSRFTSKDQNEPPVHNLDVNLHNPSMSDKSELTMETMRSSPTRAKTLSNLDLLDALKRAVQSQITMAGTHSGERKKNTKTDHSSDDYEDENSRPKSTMLKNKMHLHIGTPSTEDTATMTTISEDESTPAAATNILTAKSSNVTYTKDVVGDASTISSRSFFSSNSDSTVTENFRFDRLHSYGKKQQQFRREIDAIHKVELIKREYIFNCKLEEKKKRMRQKTVLPPPEKRGQRIHDTYSSKKNEEGRKRREAIARKNELKAQRRLYEMRL